MTSSDTFCWHLFQVVVTLFHFLFNLIFLSLKTFLISQLNFNWVSKPPRELYPNILWSHSTFLFFFSFTFLHVAYLFFCERKISFYFASFLTTSTHTVLFKIFHHYVRLRKIFTRRFSAHFSRYFWLITDLSLLFHNNPSAPGDDQLTPINSDIILVS